MPVKVISKEKIYPASHALSNSSTTYEEMKSI